jgi:LmbE family N-acetylglucosaminyl deacetylase
MKNVKLKTKNERFRRSIFNFSFLIFNLLFFASLRLCGENAFASEPEPPFERGLDLIRNELLVARSGIRALSLAAHPDDEDGGTLSYLRRTLGVETHICYTTRGEGGQNESGPELGADLAVLRTKEIEAACAILGAKAWYMNMPDFGFSKSADETLKIWGHDIALAAMVRIIRIVRPHIIFTNHDPNGTDHGHHVATGRLAVEAFDAAADPNKFPEQMKADGTQPWQVSKLYLRRFKPEGATLSFDISARDVLTGLSAPEIAAYALSKHVSQGMFREVRLGEQDARNFTLIKTQLAKTEQETSIIDGFPKPDEKTPVAASITNDWQRALGTPDGVKSIITLSFMALQLAHEQPALSEYETHAIAHIRLALREAVGLRIQPRLTDRLVSCDEPFAMTFRIANTGPFRVQIKNWRTFAESSQWETHDEAIEKDLNPGDSLEVEAKSCAKSGAFPTFPAAEYIFSRIQTRSPLSAEVSFTVGIGAKYGEVVSVDAPVTLDLAKPLTTSIRPDPVLLFDDPDHDENFSILARFHLVVTNHRKLDAPWKLFSGIQPANEAPVDKFVSLNFTKREETLSDEFRFLAPVDQLNKGDLQVQTAVWTADQNFGGPLVRIRRVPIRMPPTLNVALVKTYDDTVWNALKALENAGLGLSIAQLSDDDLRAADLNRYHTIILDIRATQYRPEIRNVKQRLEQYMKDGGNVLCLYQKDFDWNAPDKDHPARGVGFFRGEGDGGEIAPYPIELSFDRVTNKDAPVRILQPTHPLLLEPNKIWAKDFQGWEQERGVYFPKKWDEHYTALLSSNDEGGTPLDGGLLVADVGQGSFIYTSYVWHRQLRAGVPGAYRFFANMISYPRVKRTNK